MLHALPPWLQARFNFPAAGYLQDQRLLQLLGRCTNFSELKTLITELVPCDTRGVRSSVDAPSVDAPSVVEVRGFAVARGGFALSQSHGLTVFARGIQVPSKTIKIVLTDAKLRHYRIYTKSE